MSASDFFKEKKRAKNSQKKVAAIMEANQVLSAGLDRLVNNQYEEMEKQLREAGMPPDEIPAIVEQIKLDTHAGVIQIFNQKVTELKQEEKANKILNAELNRLVNNQYEEMKQQLSEAGVPPDEIPAIIGKIKSDTHAELMQRVKQSVREAEQPPMAQPGKK
jgi:2-oxo-4-hydroxy-4-carboxy--5-ureidoimidazoline (OHCU) decarboxylase